MNAEEGAKKILMRHNLHFSQYIAEHTVIIQQCVDDQTKKLRLLVAKHRRRLKAMMPLFVEARDALPAIQMASAKMRGLSLTLADRMDAVGNGDSWATLDAEDAKAAERAENNNGE